MSGPVDVLAVMDEQIRGVERDGKETALALRVARAAVAELIESAQAYADATGNDSGLRKAFGTCAVIASRKLRAALARAQGGAA